MADPKGSGFSIERTYQALFIAALTVGIGWVASNVLDIPILRRDISTMQSDIREIKQDLKAIRVQQ